MLNTYKPVLFNCLSSMHYNFMKRFDETVRKQLAVLRKQCPEMNDVEDEVEAITKFVSDYLSAVTFSKANFLDYCCLTHFEIYKDELHEFTQEELVSVNKLIHFLYYRNHR